MWWNPWYWFHLIIGQVIEPYIKVSVAIRSFSAAGTTNTVNMPVATYTINPTNGGFVNIGPGNGDLAW